MKVAICEKCGKIVGKVPDDATDIICFKCNEEQNEPLQRKANTNRSPNHKVHG